MNKKGVLLIGILVLFLSISVNAQKQQFAFFDIQQILVEMPEAEQAQALFEKEQNDVLVQFEEMQVTFNNLYQDYLTNQELPDNSPDKWSKIRAEEKQKALTDIQQRMQEFQMTAQEDLQKRQVELLTPVYNKIDSAVAVVAEEKGYPFVFSTEDVYFINEKKCIDITSLIKKALGLL